MSLREETMNQIKTIRKNLRELREEKGWSIKELSKKSKINAEVLRLIEDDTDFDMEHFFTLCDLYNIEEYKIFLPIEK